MNIDNSTLILRINLTQFRFINIKNIDLIGFNRFMIQIIDLNDLKSRGKLRLLLIVKTLWIIYAKNHSLKLLLIRLIIINSYSLIINISRT